MTCKLPADGFTWVYSIPPPVDNIGCGGGGVSAKARKINGRKMNNN